MFSEQLLRALGQLVLGLVWQWLSARRPEASSAKEVPFVGSGITSQVRQAKARSEKLNGNGANMGSGETAYSDGSSGFLPGLIVGSVIGALAGAAAALWFAPQSGVATQEKLKESATKLKEQADDALHQAQSNVQQATQKAREKAETALHQGQTLMHEQAQKASRTAENMVDAAGHEN